MTGQLGGASLSELFHRRLWELLGDGKWHDIEPVITDLGQLVPPGMAVRKAEDSRRNSNQYLAHGRKVPPEEVRPRVKYRDTADLIRSGRRRIVTTLFRPTVGKTSDGGPFRTRTLANGRREIRMVRKSRFLVHDDLRAEQLRAPFSSLAATFAAQGHDYAAEQVQLTAHEYGFHLSTCPADCSLTRLTKQRRLELELDETEG